MHIIAISILFAQALFINAMSYQLLTEADLLRKDAVAHSNAAPMFAQFSERWRGGDSADDSETTATSNTESQETFSEGHEKEIRAGLEPGQTFDVEQKAELEQNVEPDPEPMPPLGNYLTRVPTVCKQDYEVRSSEDLAVLQECTIVTGDIRIIDYKDPIVTLNNLEVLSGSLIVTKSPWVVRIEAPKLVRITEAFHLSELTSLSLVLLPELKSVKILMWKVLPILSNVNFNNEIEDMESITVSDTSLAGFAGFVAEKLEILDISNNRFLDTIVCNVKHITERLHISANSAEVVLDLPHLKTAKNVSIHEVLDIQLNMLEEIQNSASLANNYFSSLKLPKLESVGGTLSLLKNERLSQVEFPLLTEIGGGLMLVNNTKIERINFFPNLSIIGGAIEMIGNIKETSFKLLKLVKGSAKIRSSSSSFDCTRWTRLEIAKVIRGGKIVCINSENQSVVHNSMPLSNELLNSLLSAGDEEYGADTMVSDEHKETSAALLISSEIIIWALKIGLVILAV